jgi:hydroxymethylpyrimidine pyrophosphatase-like HAD family hydrolase
MRYVCLTCDFDGTIARDGAVPDSTLQGLEKLRASGRKLILATGRLLDDLLAIFPHVSLFDRVIAENGAVLYRPSSNEQSLLAEPPPKKFVERLARRGVDPLCQGRCVVSTWHPNETIVLAVIRDMSLDLQIIFNKHAVMILPSGVNKGTGLQVALSELQVSPHNVVGVGDAENDHPFMNVCECCVAVSNAVPALKERADWVTENSHGAGVEELIQALLKNDLADLAPPLYRHNILLGTVENGEPCSLPTYGLGLLVAGPSGSGKSTVVTAIVERLIENKYQVCIFDPEGDFDEFEKLMTIGGPERVPKTSEILEFLANPQHSLNLNLLGVPLADRPAFFQQALARIQELRFKTGHPHWVVIDEAHHLLPAELLKADLAVPQNLKSFLLVTVHPEMASPAILRAVNGIITVGPEPEAVIYSFNRTTGSNLQARGLPTPQTGQVLVFCLNNQEPVRLVRVEPASTQRKRHLRKYAAGELGEDKSFYFRGPKGKLNLRAQNMNLFAQIAEGLDDSTWKFHLSNGDYSRWLRESIKDDEIAKAVADIERNSKLSASESKRLVIRAIRKHYTAPA